MSARLKPQFDLLFLSSRPTRLTNSLSNTPSKTPTLLPQSPETPPAKTEYPYTDAEYKQSLPTQSPPQQSPPASRHENPGSKMAAYAQSLPPSSSTQSQSRESTVIH